MPMGRFPGRCCRIVAVCASADADYAFPSKSAIKDYELWALVPEGPEGEVTISCRTARCDTDR